MKRIILLTGILILFTSCADPYLSVSKLGECELGESYEYYDGEDSEFDVEVISRHNLEELSKNDNEYKVLLYETLLYSKSYSPIPSGRDFIFFAPFSSEYYTYTALAFENDELIFYGYPEDFLKNESKLINEIGHELISIIDKKQE